MSDSAAALFIETSHKSRARRRDRHVMGKAAQIWAQWGVISHFPISPGTGSSGGAHSYGGRGVTAACDRDSAVDNDMVAFRGATGYQPPASTTTWSKSAFTEQ